MTRVIHEDAELLVVDKPDGIAAIPERDLQVPSLHKLLEAERGERLWVVHRLDKEVSGLLVFARTAEAHRRLSMAFEARRVGKTYLAVVHGRLDGRGEIDAPIHQFGSGRMGVDPRGKPSRTTYEVLGQAAAHSLVTAHPQTGRRHQLRVHFYHRGHPIAGDVRYGEVALQKTIARLMLHARNLELPLADGRTLALEAPAGPTFTAEARRLGLVVEGEARDVDGRKD